MRSDKVRLGNESKHKICYTFHNGRGGTDNDLDEFLQAFRNFNAQDIGGLVPSGTRGRTCQLLFGLDVNSLQDIQVPISA